jgi:ABC-type glycerol-3-phosphate transport system substrate-binding protein
MTFLDTWGLPRARLDRRALLRYAAAIVAGSSAGIVDPSRGRAQPGEPILRVIAPNTALLSTFRSVAQAFSETSGIRVSVVPTPPESILFAIAEDARTGVDGIDAAIVPAWSLGDLLVNEWIQPVGSLLDDASPVSPERTTEFSSVAALRTWDGVHIATPVSGSCQVLYYWRELLDLDSDADPDAAIQPTVWESLDRMTGPLRNAGIAPLALHAARGAPVALQYLAFAAPRFASEAMLDRFWFDPDSFEPRIASEQHVAVVETFARLGAESSMDAPLSVASASARFLSRAAATIIAGPDLLPLAITREIGSLDDLGVIAVPSNLESGATPTAIEHDAGNTLGPNWGGVVHSRSDVPELAAQLLEMIAIETATPDAPWTPNSGLVPVRPEQLPAELDGTGQADVSMMLEAGASMETLLAWSSAIQETLSSPLHLPMLRIPGAFEYHTALDQRLHELLTGAAPSSREALEAASRDFVQISDRHGAERQQQLYAASTGISS